MQTVLITGAASGVGLATAKLAAQKGWRCVLVDRNADSLLQLLPALDVSPLGPHLLKPLDLTETKTIEQLAQDLPSLDALINNAGISDDSNVPLVQQTSARIESVLALNLRAPAAMVQALSSKFVADVRIVNVASGAGLRSIPWRGAYSPSKAGLIAQTRALAQAQPQWCVTALSPGFVRTELVANLIHTGRLHPENALAKIPLGRMAEPEEMAAALCFLASPAAAALSGELLCVDGGSSVYGGSQGFSGTGPPPCPFDVQVAYEISGDAERLLSPSRAGLASDAVAYRACIDASLMQAAPGTLLQGVMAVAQRFANQSKHAASLSLLLPAHTHADWAQAGDLAATRMLIATLACEWARQGLRINALECERMHAPDLWPVLHFIGGATAQYLTGQVLRIRPHRELA